MPHEELQRRVSELRLQIAIDGPAGAGKSTLGHTLACVLECPHLDTGIMYRAVTWKAIESGINTSDGDALSSIAGSIEFRFDDQTQPRLMLDGLPPSPTLRSRDVDDAVAQVSAHAGVRHALVLCQRRLASHGSIVMIGRDIGTVVLPDAPVKLWIMASPEERARRRLREGLPGTSAANEEEIVRRMMERDEVDTNRAISPLVPASDATVIDTTRLTENESLERAVAAVEAIISRRAAVRG